MKIGIIGSGNMATALASGFINSNAVEKENILISDANEKVLEKWAKYGVSVTTDNLKVCEFGDIVIYAVKPNILPSVLEETKPGAKSKTLISIAAGVTIETIEKYLGKGMHILRAMPNTPAQVGCGMTVLSPNKNITDSELEIAGNLFSGIGSVAILDEKHINAATALHGSSPAYVYMLIEAMANSGVKYGIPKDVALILAAKAVEGSAKMVLETKKHPSELKDAVCSPGGTTIAAVLALEESGFTSAIAKGIDACVEKAEEMSKK